MAQPASNRSIYLPDAEWAWADAQAEQMGLSVNGLVRLAVRKLQLELNAADLNRQPPLVMRPPTLPPYPSGGAKPDVQGKIQSKPAASLTVATDRRLAHGVAELAYETQIGPSRSVPGSRLKKGRGG